MGPRSHQAAAGRREVASGAERPRRRLHATAARARPALAPHHRDASPSRTARPAPLPRYRPHARRILAFSPPSTDPHKEPRPLSGRHSYVAFTHIFCSTSLTGNELSACYTTDVIICKILIGISKYLWSRYSQIHPKQLDLNHWNSLQ